MTPGAAHKVVGPVAERDTKGTTVVILVVGFAATCSDDQGHEVANQDKEVPDDEEDVGAPVGLGDQLSDNVGKSENDNKTSQDGDQGKCQLTRPSMA